MLLTSSNSSAIYYSDIFIVDFLLFFKCQTEVGKLEKKEKKKRNERKEVKQQQSFVTQRIQTIEIHKRINGDEQKKNSFFF